MARRKKDAATGNGGLVPFDDGNDAALVGFDADWLNEMQGFAREETATAGSGGGWPFISLRGAVFTFNDQTMSELPPVIILGAAKENTYYSQDFDAEKAQSPDCFAIGMTADGRAIPDEMMAPPDHLASKESTQCRGCWANAFRSARKGRGKACGNRVKLAVIPADNLDPDVLANVEGARIRVPVTSINNKVHLETGPNGVEKWLSWSDFTRQVAAKKLNLFAVIAR
jgi:hypothetical protein